ncbi:D-glycero-beta-D-manno-heptose 1-phosphate adenylyltransferase [Emticicia agri]|uniref:D-glycero-beta-D-manno-heptose 1-phosphate adenylyltransferase n=1 Tax=Emticicia agri TaxID=2492393 RepID=A0A4Q5M212_9BACT|nr:D-glycero-beta-D-manno-heptose 1-phosphate adenylyltransferase [Emticicia agri]RYU96272.1 D-glycero-beta-D-manno-heptose 1-phosphate adenylyltransferase [Emticicia agri]
MTESKIQTKEEALKQIQQWQSEGKKIVFTNGCFDIVHLGHIDYLEKARNLGDKLVLGLNTDASVRRLKGESRPIVNEYARARMMSAFEFVDTVILFDEPTPKELIETLCPNILVKGDDYTVANIVGADFVISKGGEVKTISLVNGYSTTSIIKKIKDLD